MASELNLDKINNKLGTKTFINTVTETIDNIKLLPRAVTTSVNDAGTFTNREIVAIVDGSGVSTGEMRIHDGATVGGKDISAGSLQLNTITGAVSIASNSNKLYFGDTTFSNTVTVEGYMVVMGGHANFTSTVNVTGTLYLG
jgi:hypothetical protein